MASKYRSWKEYNDANIKLLQKRNKIERDIQKEWRNPDKVAKLKIKLDKLRNEIEAHERDNYIPSSSTRNFVKWV